MSCHNCQRAKAIVKAWVGKQVHDKCHYYPELFEQLREMYNLEPEKALSLPPREEFRAECQRFESKLYER
jgi:hypothetical protein